jgi:hypothetical protein
VAFENQLSRSYFKVKELTTKGEPQQGKKSIYWAIADYLSFWCQEDCVLIRGADKMMIAA